MTTVVRHPVVLLMVSIFVSSLFCEAFLCRPRRNVGAPGIVASSDRDDVDLDDGEPIPGAAPARRREFLSASLSLLGATTTSRSSAAETEPEQQQQLQVSEEELDSLYDNPAVPQAPEERSGLVVLRVAEVAQFQEKILRSIASGELEGVKVAPMQFTFGTQILLRNSNLDGNMRLMIYQEVPWRKRKAAMRNAADTMNRLQEIIKYTTAIQRDFETRELIELADMYLDIRVQLNELYDYLPEKEKNKYYGYFAAVTEYEKKIADGVYNPDIDGVLKFD